MKRKYVVALVIFLTGLASIAIANRVLAPPVGGDAELDLEPKDPERASFVVEGEVVRRYTRNIRDRRAEDPGLQLPTGSPEERRDAENFLSKNWIYGVYEVKVEDWRQLATGDTTHPNEPRLNQGVIAIYRGLSDAPRPDGPFRSFSQDVRTGDFERVEVGNRYRFVVEEDEFFRRHWYKLGMVSPIG